MEYLSAVGIGLFAAWLPLVAIWLLIAFGLPQLVAFALPRLSPARRKVLNAPLEKAMFGWLLFWLFVAPAWFVYILADPNSPIAPQAPAFAQTIGLLVLCVVILFGIHYFVSRKN